ncbi:MAG TPA: hypothetical protein VFX91_02400 [Alcanivorax sp.]|nr:hypothetical protein [Alcanivorax sp.]
MCTSHPTPKYCPYQQYLAAPWLLETRRDDELEDIAFCTPLAYIFVMIFIETPIFTKRLRGLLDDESYADFQQELGNRPDMGDVIQGTGGLRKVRVASSGRGKRGGARVIYYYFVRRLLYC